MRARAAKASTALLLAAFLGGAPALAQEAAGGAQAGSPARGDAPATAAPPGGAPPSVPSAEGPSPADDSVFRATLPLDIATASFYELVAWARSLGLAESGSASEIRERLYGHYGVSAPPAAKAGGMTVTIERAARASYFKVEEGEGGVVRASGGVVLAISEEGGSAHRVEADEIAYDRERGAVTARGSVRYERKSGTGSEIFSGEALSASLDDWSGVFIDGKVRRAGDGATAGDRGLAMAAETMLKRSGDVLILENGVISSCDAEDPHYAIRAGKVWLLGDKEWAISDALFSVGNVPLLWLPFFYFPGDELVFHPVYGFRSREGRFVQTTTYLIGQKPKKTETTSIMKLMDQGSGATGPLVLKGLFLRRVSGPAPKDSGTLKAMLDLYSGLGAYAGIQGSLPRLGPFDKLDFGLGLGLSRSLFNVGTANYSPYASAGSWKSVWNGSDFLGLDLPLRFALDLSGSLRAGSLSSSFSLPLMSDPFFNQDFKNRSEDMDWLGFLKPEETTTTIAKTSSLSQTANLSFNLSPKLLSPWIKSIDVTRLGASMSWLSTTLPLASYTGGSSALYAVDPSREFFYPSLLRPIDAALSLRGSLFSYPVARPGAAAAAPGSGAEKPAETAELRSPWAEEAEGATGGPSGGESSKAVPAEAGDAKAATGGPFRLPQRAPSVPAPTKPEEWSAGADWSLTPSAYLEDSYRTKEWTDPSAIDMALLYALFSYRIAATLDSRASYRSGLLTGSLGLAYADQDQSRPYLYDLSSYADKAAALKLADYQYKSRKLTGSLRLSSKPLASSWLWSASSLNYSLDANLYSSKYASMSAGSPVYSTSSFAWDSTNVTSHSAGVTLAVRPWNLSQSLGLTMSLPPTTESYSARLALDGGPVDLSLSDRMYRASSSADYSFDPLTASLSFAQDPWPGLSDTFIYDVKAGEPVSNVTTLTWGPLSTSLTAKKAIAYEPVIGSGWKAVGSESFRASNVSMALKGTFKSPEGSAAAWSVTGNASLAQSLLRFSESSLSLGVTASLKVAKALELSLSSQSQSSSAWRYYPELFSAPSTLSGWPEAYRKPFLADLWESVSIWDADALRRSLFKLKSLSLKVSHDLHDWDLSAELSAKPLLKTAERKYVLDPSFTILLVWRDLAEIKTKALYDTTSGFRY